MHRSQYSLDDVVTMRFIQLLMVVPRDNYALISIAFSSKWFSWIYKALAKQ